MKNKKFAAIALLIAVLFLLLAAAGLKNKKMQLEKAVAISSLPLAVKALEVQNALVKRSVPALATVKSAASVQIKAEAGGTILKLGLREGDVVEVGQQLAVIDNREQEAQLQAAVARKDSAGNQVSAMNASLEALFSQLEAAKINLEYWADEYARGEKLFNAKAVTQSAMDNMRNRKAEAESRVTSLEAQIVAQKAQINSVQAQQKAAEKDVQVWKVRRDYTEIAAPVAGIISARFQEEGNRVVTGAPLFNIEDISRTRLILQIPQESAMLVRVGQEVVCESFCRAAFRVSRIYPVQNELRQVTVEAEYAGAIEGMVFDMQVPVKIVVESMEGPVVPQDARFEDYNVQGNYVSFIVSDSRARRVSYRPVIAGDDGLMIADNSEIVPGCLLAAGSYLENIRLPASFAVEVIK